MSNGKYHDPDIADVLVRNPDPLLGPVGHEACIDKYVVRILSDGTEDMIGDILATRTPNREILVMSAGTSRWRGLAAGRFPHIVL